MTRVLRPQPLTKAAFARFGDVIEPTGDGDTINYGAAAKFADLARIDVAREGGRPSVHLYSARPLPPPITIEIMERHPLGSQAFAPLDARDFIVVVAPAGDLDPDAISAFRAAGGQGVNFAPGVWHHFCLALSPTRFLVIDRTGPGENLDEVRLAPEQQWRLKT